MKLLKLSGVLAMLMCAFVFSSCSDDDESTGSAADLVGTWQSVQRIYWEKTDGVMDPGDSEEWEEYTKLKLEFRPDGQVVSHEYDSGSGEWEDESVLNYRYEDGLLYLTHPKYGMTQSVKVLTLTSTTLDIVESHIDREYEDGHKWELYSRIQLSKL